MDNPQVQLFQKRFPYYEIEGDPETNMVIFKHDEYVKNAFILYPTYFLY